MSIDRFHEDPDLEVDLQDFIEENEFVKITEDLFECPGGHFWREGEIYDLAMERQNEKAYNNI
jgi:hypothetical protein|tara:strand:- start:473 stop:661 length:189 start_codon:yes stop_codon:yes gene_type:complete